MISKEHPIRKIITKHLFDFFMLFLAVSLGFIVDNYREQRDSDKLAFDLSNDLILDVQQDSIAIQTMQFHCNLKKLRLDSLSKLIDDNAKEYNDSLIYYYTAFALKRPWFEKHGSTFALLVNAGYLDNLSKEASAAITSYEKECSKLIYNLELENQIIQTKINPFIQQKFNTEYFDSITNARTFTTKLELHNWDNQTRWLLHNYVSELINLNNTITNHYIHLSVKANITLTILKKEYN
jgi:hypothetical protein